MTRTATTAQATRIARITAEAQADGGRVTTRKLSNGTIRVTEYSDGEKIAMDLDLDGNWITETASAEGDDLDADAEAMTVATILDALPSETRAAIVARMTRDERRIVARAITLGRKLKAAARAA